MFQKGCSTVLVSAVFIEGGSWILDHDSCSWEEQVVNYPGRYRYPDDLNVLRSCSDVLFDQEMKGGNKNGEHGRIPPRKGQVISSIRAHTVGWLIDSFSGWL